MSCCNRQQAVQPATAYNDEWLAGVVDQLSAFDRDMNTVVVDSGILAGIPTGALARAGECSEVHHDLCAHSF